MPTRKPRLTPEQARAVKAEIERRNLEQGKAFTAEAFAGKHGEQLKYLLCTAQYVIACCSRRAGKTYANCALLALTALATPNVVCVYLGLTIEQVKATAWIKAWKPLLRKYKLDHESTEDMVTTFPNGSIVYFGSLSTEKSAAKWLGSSLAGGICIIDECQEASAELLTTTEKVIEPTLSDVTDEHPIAGRLVWSGTFPETPAGRFWDLYTDKEGAYAQFSWNRFQNPFLKNQELELEKVLKRLHVTATEPFIQRDWFGSPVYDKNATAYGFDPARNYYDHVSPDWLGALDLPPFRVLAAVPNIPTPCTQFVIGIDPAAKADRYAIEVWGWGPHSDKLFQVFEAVTERGANPLQSQANAVVVEICKRYKGVSAVVRDHGSAAVSDDTLLREYGIANIEPATKAELGGRVARVRDLLGTGRAFVMRGSALAEDFQKARWNVDARANGQYKWHASHHPDAGDAANYAIQKYFSLYKPPPPAPKSLIEMMEDNYRNLWRPSVVQYGPQDEIPNNDEHYGGPQE